MQQTRDKKNLMKRHSYDNNYLNLLFQICSSKGTESNYRSVMKQNETRLVNFANVLAKLLARFRVRKSMLSRRRRVCAKFDSSLAISREFLLADRFNCVELGKDHLYDTQGL